MKNMMKVLAVVMALAVVLSLGSAAFAAGGPVTLDQAKHIALDRAGVKASDASFTKAYKTYDDGREVYEIEFYVGNTEYDMDVDVNTGNVTDFSMEVHNSYGSYSYSGHAGYGAYGYDYDDDDMFDYDYDDMFDFD